MRNLYIIIVSLISFSCAGNNKKEISSDTSTNFTSKPILITENKDSLYKKACDILDDLDSDPSKFHKAFKMLEKSCDQGNYDACSRLGEEYLDGLKIKKDEKRAIDYLNKGDEGKSFYASFDLYKYYFKKSEFDKSFFYLTETKNRNKELAVYNLYYWYKYGECSSCGNPDISTTKYKNDDSAFFYLKQSACYNKADAYMDLGIYYLKGYKNIITQDSSRAACCFTKAFELGKSIPAYSDEVEIYLEQNIGRNWKEWLNKKEDEDCDCENISK